MLNYLHKGKDRLRSLKGGMEKNPSIWTEQTVDIANVERQINNIDNANAAVETAKQQVTIKSAEARELILNINKLADKIENLAWGFHSDYPEKLAEYGIKAKRAYTAKPSPTKIIIPELKDDTDGEGFIVSTQSDPNADYYEWQKGMGANASDLNIIPELRIFKTTKKTSFKDDEVPKGVRIFYRVRAANSNGVGPWSEAVSRVQ